MYFVIAASVVVALILGALACFLDVYVTGNKGSATASALLLTAAICLVLYQLSDSVLTAMSMIFVAEFTVGLTLLVALRRFAGTRAALRKAKTKTMTTPEQ